MEPETRPDDWRNLRRAPAWLAFVTTGIVLLYGIANLIGTVRDNLFNATHTVFWAIGAVLLVGACATAVNLLRADDPDDQAGLSAGTAVLWALGVFVIMFGENLWGML
ncbi:hypothetical protein [Dactylosporangium salmoneum]|uniref:Uncharacterized protein n=1 Tax=Dactylosporangium salmoneum TaxID=53361 RepID=A0ABP5SY18_9ACTN